MATLTYTGGREAVTALFTQLLDAAAGTGPDPHGLAQAMQARLGNVLLSKIRQAYLEKARGGTDECGIRWAPLSPVTVAGRRLGKADRQSLAGKSRLRALSPAERKLERREYRKRLTDLVARGLPRTRAQALARAQAFNRLRGRDAAIPTRLALLGFRQVDILIDTGELLASFSPGVEDRPSHTPGQVFETPPGRVIVGSALPRAAYHHRGTSRLPARPFWPPDGHLPDSWWEALLVALRRGLSEAVTSAVTRGAAA